MPNTDALVPIDTIRGSSRYGVSEAAKLAGVSVSTVRRWVDGVYGSEAVFSPTPPEVSRVGRRRVSFLQLVEILIVAAFRREEQGHKPASLEELRTAHRIARNRWPDLRYPFASKRWERSGPDMLHEEGGGQVAGLVSFTQANYVFPPMVRETISVIEYGTDYAERFLPGGADIPIVIDPAIYSGRPVVSGTGVPLEQIQARLTGSWSAKEIARDFEIPIRVVRKVLEYLDAA